MGDAILFGVSKGTPVLGDTQKAASEVEGLEKPQTPKPVAGAWARGLGFRV